MNDSTLFADLNSAHGISLRCAINTLKQMSFGHIKEEATMISFKSMGFTQQNSTASHKRPMQLGLLAQGSVEVEKHPPTTLIDLTLASATSLDEHCELSPDGKLLAVNVEVGSQDSLELLQKLLEKIVADENREPDSPASVPLTVDTSAMLIR